MLEHEFLTTTSATGSVRSAVTWPRACDTCRSAPCAVFCRADSAYLCAGCDSRIHAANRVASRHERVWVCEACERAPAAFLCKADAASLCSSCDADIHSANPLASRHQRVPILPISGYLYGPPTTLLGADDEGFVGGGCAGGEVEEEEDEGMEDEAASWLLLNPLKNSNNNSNNHNNNINNNSNDHNNQEGNNGFLFSGEVDEYLDLVDCNSCGGGDNTFTTNTTTTTTTTHHDEYSHQQQDHYGVPQKSYVGDSVVPVQQQQVQNFQLGLEFESSKAGFSYNGGSISQSVSVSSMDVGVVPESTMRDVSMNYSRTSKGTIDLFSGPPIQMSSHFSPMDREARVLRYREKKKTRKFEKTIRYASRKAYAETRPRIKGRFAKRTDADAEVDQMFSTSLITEVGYGIVPSF
ncbi:zinc finger protein CONSTANS-LIKE 2 [Trifolium pratense]|uniref:zinc finger protein CONSTANS-LIKE 2 n=1 Tax=Trifolium pratense TaxID=57577 RepID=UPI001E6948BE|nr:zinc finger protein CONSTANS-LIKE 2 [Trifolium pratense]